MKTYDKIIRSYAQALKDNDYQAIIKLFSKDAKIFSFQAEEQPPSTFFQNLLSERYNYMYSEEKIVINL